MLFAAKNSLAWTASALAALLGLSLAMHHVLALPWNWQASTAAWGWGAAGALVIAASDGLGHLLHWALLGERYLVRYRKLVASCAPQRAWHILASGPLAAGEEVFFRGTLLVWLLELSIPAPWALVATAVLFGAANAIPRRELWPFWIWAVWEGVLLGGVYLASGSLLVGAVVHGLHDIAGFALFAYQRRTGWLMGKKA